MVRRGGFRAKFGQRLGLYTAEDRKRIRSREWIWIQSISVGETFIALKLAQALHSRWPEVGIIVSTTTSTGFAEAARAACDWLEPIYNPVDARSIIRRALDLVRPRQLIVIEGGLWPNLVSACRTRGIPVSLVNARLSPRSERRFLRFRRWTGPIFRLLDRIFIPDERDISRWEALGVETTRIVRTGSIKFDNPSLIVSRAEEFRKLIESLGVPSDAPILLGGSTWDPEERVLADIAASLRQEFPGLLLILVPRHVERGPEIIRALESSGRKVARRTAIASTHTAEAPEVLLIDTTGELRDWYALATVVFIGKSLPGIREVGGQNPAEPAVLGKPIVFGPHMENFAALVAELLARGAALQVATAAELREQIRPLVRDATRREALGNHARSALAAHAGATARVAELLLAENPKKALAPRESSPTVRVPQL
jgi:3-deoxy-D-manno-octulosonic-acid transferase